MGKNFRIFLTGGTGFFGKSLLAHCRELRNCELVILSRNPEKLIGEIPGLKQDKRIKFMQGDIRDFELDNENFDYIFHGAATSGTVVSDDETRSVIIDGTKHIIDFATSSGVKKILYVSSGAVYGNNNTTAVSEDFPCEPVNIYGSAKLEAEKLCLESGLPCCIARCFAFVGEYLPLDAHFAIGNFIRDCLDNRPIVIKGDGSPLRSYLYAGDLAQWLWTILLNGKNGEAYNVGSDFSVSIAELASIVRTVAGTDNEIQILSPPSGTRPQCYVPDISKASRELGLEVETALEDAIRKTIDFYKDKK